MQPCVVYARVSTKEQQTEGYTNCIPTGRVGTEVHTIGDAAKVRRAHNATMDGHKIGLEV